MEVQDYLAQEGSFRQIDQIISIQYQKRSEALRIIKENEFWVQDHFPNNPIFPGVLLLEAMGQTGGLLFMNELQKKTYGYLNQVDHFKLLHPIRIGTRIHMIADYMDSYGIFHKARVVAYVEKKKVAGAEITYALPMESL